MAVLTESRPAADGPILVCHDLRLAFEGLVVLDHVSFSVLPGQLFAIIGPNGAGKTSVFNCLSGVYHPQGSINFLGRELVGMPPHRIAAMGIARTFQNVALFDRMTVLDNLLLGRHHRISYGPLLALLRVGPARRQEDEHRRVVEAIIEFLEIEAHRRTPVGLLPFGIRKRVELGRALAMDSSLLLLDEPVAGMNLEETEDMARFILDVQEELHLPIILVEHEMRMVMDLADLVLVLDFGRPVALGTPEAIQHNPDVIRAYLGQEHAEIGGAT